ncbi:hypothetical protein [Flavobacterium sp. N3904]|uniref:bestrophin-like domain n=1 Tax=Flavobacterium sp. N3904 TaxID=2986835 RepID=UPI002224DC82|nr:hypothetical protein [Flavobacterium sp. N3904]
MDETLLNQTPAYIIIIVLLILMFLTYRLGYLFRVFEIKKNDVISNDGLNPIQASFFGLVALLLSFTFNMAAVRYDNRRAVIVEEANSIRTAILCTDMYPEALKKNLLTELEKYVDFRITYYTADINEQKIDLAKRNSNQVFKKIWTAVIKDAENPEHLIRSQQMIPALNKMINVVASRDAIITAKVPKLVLYLLFIAVLLASFTVGYTNIEKQKNHLLAIVFSITVVFTVFIILNLDRPRRGMINVNSTEQKIVELKNLF